MYNGKITRMDKHNDSETHRVLDLALKAGRIALQNGAEIFRVEETIEYICRHFGIEEMDAFVLSNGIFLTAYNEGQEMYARVKHVPARGTHLGIVAEINDLSREITAGHVTVDEAHARLEEIEKSVKYFFNPTICFAMLKTLSEALYLFSNIPGYKS